MNRLHAIIICLVETFCCIRPTQSLAEAAKPQDEWLQVELNVANDGQLGTFFDAGLRPFHFPSLENSVLGFKHLQAIFVMADGARLPAFSSEWGQLHVQKDHKVSTIELRNSGVNLAEAFSEMSKWLSFSTSPERTATDLEAFIKTVEANPMGYNIGPRAVDHDFALQWKDTSNTLYGIWFHNCRNQERPLAVYMSVTLPLTPAEASAFFESPIPPPKGYETVSMTPPKEFGPDTPPDSKEVKEVMREGRMPDYSELNERKREAPRDSPNPASKTPEAVVEAPILPATKATSPVSTGKWIALGLMLAVAWVVFGLKKRL
jgi:hypothetical protein